MTWALDAMVVVLTTFIRVLGPGGVKALVAENLALRQQLLVVKRKQRKAPNLRTVDRLLLGISAMFIRAGRVSKIAVVVSPSTTLQFHRALVRRKYRCLFSSKPKSKPGPKGPSAELRVAIVAIKWRNPRFGCRRIAMIVSRTFGVEIDKDVVRRGAGRGLPSGPTKSWPLLADLPRPYQR